MIDQKKYISFIEMYRRAYSDLQKDKQYSYRLELWIKVKIYLEQYENTIWWKLFWRRKIGKCLQLPQIKGHI